MRNLKKTAGPVYVNTHCVGLSCRFRLEQSELQLEETIFVLQTYLQYDKLS